MRLRVPAFVLSWLLTVACPVRAQVLPSPLPEGKAAGAPSPAPSASPGAPDEPASPTPEGAPEETGSPDGPASPMPEPSSGAGGASPGPPSPTPEASAQGVSSPGAPPSPEVTGAATSPAPPAASPAAGAVPEAAPATTPGPGGRPAGPRRPRVVAAPPTEQDVAIERQKRLHKETVGKVRAIRDLILIGDRALASRFFEEARQALEQGRLAAIDQREQWFKFRQNLEARLSENARLSEWFTRLTGQVLSEVIALRNLLRAIQPSLAQVYLEKGQYQEAVAQLEAAVEIDPTDARLWLQLARAQQKKEDYDESIKSFFRSVEIDRWQRDAFYELSRSFAKKGEVKTALVYLRRAISLGYNRFDQIALDEELSSLRGDPEFDEIVYFAPEKPY